MWKLKFVVRNGSFWWKMEICDGKWNLVGEIGNLWLKMEFHRGQWKFCHGGWNFVVGDGISS